MRVLVGVGLTITCQVGRLVGWLVGQSVGRSVGQSVGRLVSHQVSWLVGRSVGRSVSQLVVNRQVGQLVSHQVSWLVGRSVSQLVVNQVGRLVVCLVENVCWLFLGRVGDLTQCQDLHKWENHSDYSTSLLHSNIILAFFTKLLKQIQLKQNKAIAIINKR